MSHEMVDTTPLFETLLERLAQQELSVAELAACASAQDEFIDACETDKLVVLLKRRQELIEAITDQHRHLDRLAEQVRSGELQVSEASRDDIRCRLEGISTRLTEILAHDERAQHRLSEVRASTRMQMTSHDTATSARRAYSVAATSSAAASDNNRFADERG